MSGFDDYVDESNATQKAKKVVDGVKKIGFLKNKWTWIILVSLILGSIIFSNMLYNIKDNHVGIIFNKFGKQNMVEGRFIVEKGEKGWQREVLMPAIHFFWFLEPLWKYDIEEVAFIEIKPGELGIVYAKDGDELLDGQIIARPDAFEEKMVDGKNVNVFKMGQKGPRYKVLTPGFYPINTKYLDVKIVEATKIPDGMVGIRTRKVGLTPPEGMVLVPEKNEDGTIYKGIVKEYLGPGTHYINTDAENIEQVKAVIIDKGEVGIVTKRVGKLPPEGTILVKTDSPYRGIQEEVLQPGMYYINPYEKMVKAVPAVEVHDGHVGVQISKIGKEKPSDQLLAEDGERGVLRKIIPPGLYYLNPYKVEVVDYDIRQQRYEMTFIEGQGDTNQSDSIQFLSDDGFSIEIDLTVLYQVMAQDAPYVVATIGRDVSDVQEKIIRPHSRSYARISGSMFNGEEFVHGETRKTFQLSLFEDLKVKGLANRVQINQALIRHFEVPQELRDPITKKVIATKARLQKEEEQLTAKANADLARETQKAKYESEKVIAETEKIKAITNAEQKRDVEALNKEMKKLRAEGDATQKKIAADANLYEAQKAAEGIKAKKLAEAEGAKALVDAWSGSGGDKLVAKEYANVLQGANLVPLSWVFGGGSAENGGKAPFMYGSMPEMMKFIGVEAMEKQGKGKKSNK